MGNAESKIPKNTPLGCLLLNFTRLGYSQTLRRKKLIFLSQVAWPQYQLDNKSHWPPTGTFDFNVLRDLDNFCRRTGKDKEVPYVQAFWDLRSHPDLCSTCSTHQVLLARTTLPQTPTSQTKPPPYTLQEEMPDHLSSPFVPTPEVADPPNPPPSVPPPTLPSSPSLPTPPATTAHVVRPEPGVKMAAASATPAAAPPPISSPPSSPVAAHTRTKTSVPPSVMAPLREVAGAEGLVRVHVPFSLQDLAQIERRLGSFSADPSTYIKEFQYLTQAYSLTWQDIRIICTSTLSAEEYERVMTAARHQADRDHAINPNQVPVGTEVIPTTDPQWVYQDGAGSHIPARDRMLQYLLRGLEAVSNKVVNYDKLREITQQPDENPALFLNRLQDALVRYTRLDPASQNGATILASHFISQSAPDIRKKLKKAEEGPETPIQDLVKMAFKVFNAREDAAEVARQARLKQKVALQAQALAAAQTQALVAALRPAGVRGPDSRSKPPPGGGPGSSTPVTLAEPRVSLQVAGKSVSFLLDTGATYSVLPSFQGQTTLSQVSVMGIDGAAHTPRQTPLLTCMYNSVPFSHSFLIIPSCPVPLLGRDILTKLKAHITFPASPQHLLLVAHHLSSDPDHASSDILLPEVDPKVWETDTPVVATHHKPVKIRLQEHSPRFLCRPQFPISKRHRLGLRPIIERLKSRGLLIPINSPCNTPILPVRKPSGEYRLVQDLRLVNAAVVPIHPVVPNPYTILSRIPSDTTFFSVLDLKDAFFTIPLHPDSYFIFAFTWEDPLTDNSCQLTWTVLPQGFRDSPHLFGQALATDLLDCRLAPSVVLQYVDDLLICSPSQGECTRATTILLNFLGDKGYRVSRKKAQLVTSSVIYLGLQLSPGKKSIIPDRLQALKALQPPQSATEILSFLGVVGFFRHWVPNFALLAKPLYQAAADTPEGPLTSQGTVTRAFHALLQTLCASTFLALPNPNLPFHLYTDEKAHITVGVLAQPVGNTLLPLAYLSKQLSPAEKGWPPCLRALAAAAALTTEALKINLQQPLTVFSPHKLQELVSSQALPHLGPSKVQLLHLLFLENPDISLSHCPALNPATLFPSPTAPTQDHRCLEVIIETQSPRPDLYSTPIEAEATLFVDGSSFLRPGKPRIAGYAIVTPSDVIETHSLPLGTTSQQAELVALTRALKWAKDKTVNIYTDSKYAFLIAHSHCMIWKERGFLTTKGTPVVNGRLIADLISAIQLPKQVAIIHCRGHQTSGSLVALGNAFADRTARDSAQTCPPPKEIYFLSRCYKPQYSGSELKLLQQNPEVTFRDGWAFNRDLLILPQAQKTTIVKDIHDSLHIGPKALLHFLLPILHPEGLSSLIHQVHAQCPICAKTNSQGACHLRRRLHQLRGSLPGQDWQIDFTHMPRHKKFRFLLTIVDTFSGWIEAFPTTSESADTVAAHLIQDIIPRFGLPATIQSDNGPAFVSKVTNAVCASLGIQWKLHAAYHPQSSGYSGSA
ncbi:uncharacterized protein LOC144581056 [Callithrix jacchus]